MPSPEQIETVERMLHQAEHPLTRYAGWVWTPEREEALRALLDGYEQVTERAEVAEAVLDEEVRKREQAEARAGDLRQALASSEAHVDALTPSCREARARERDLRERAVEVFDVLDAIDAAAGEKDSAAYERAVGRLDELRAAPSPGGFLPDGDAVLEDRPDEGDGNAKG